MTACGSSLVAKPAAETPAQAGGPARSANGRALPLVPGGSDGHGCCCAQVSSKARPSRRVSDLGMRSPRAPSWVRVGRTAGAEGVCRGRCSRFARSSGNVPFPHPQVFLVKSFTSHVHRPKPLFSGLHRV